MFGLESWHNYTESELTSPKNQPTSVVMFCSSCLHCTSSLIWITDFELNHVALTRSQLIYGAVFWHRKVPKRNRTPPSFMRHEKSHLWDMNQDESGDSTPWHPCWSQITWVKQRPKGSHGPLGATVTSGGRPWWGAPRRRRRSVRSHVGMEEVSNGGLLWVSRSRAQSLKGRLVVATRKTGFFNSHVVRGGEDF